MSNPGRVREIELVEEIEERARRAGGNRGVVAGIGDDCAVVRPNGGDDLVFTTDFTIENRHFTLATHSAADVGWKALARSLSDLAAMGARPVFCLVSLAVPAKVGARSRLAWIRGFYSGLTELARTYKIQIAGGDLARADRVTVDVMCCGSVRRGQALMRSGARPGDRIYVTGALGESAAGLSSRSGAAWLRHKRPQPRIAAGLALRGLASAAMDLSDGLSLDLARLCQQSGVGADLDGPLPLAPGATIAQALHGGEDYELLFTARPDRNVAASLARLPVTRVGVITGAPAKLTYKGATLEPLGFDHFQ